MDECDQGARSASFFLDQAVARARSRHSIQAGLHTCLDCGEPIPAARRQAMPGCRRCVDCATAFEGGPIGS